MAMFHAFRDGDWNTYYRSKRHAASYYVTHIIIGYFTVVVATCLLIYVISSRGKERWGALLRLIFNLHSAASILFCLTGQNWAVSTIHTSCQYISSLDIQLKGEVGLEIGLKSFNVTLIAHKSNESTSVGDVFYNEEISFVKTDDSKSAAHAGRHKGLPYAILHVLEYLEEDAGGLRWSRIYRTSGHFVYIILWAAFVTWFVGQILTSFVVSRGAILNAATGVLMVGACLLFHFLQPPSPLVVPFPDDFLQLEYGWCFWLTCGSGILTLLYGISILVIDSKFPSCTAAVLLSDAAKEDFDSDYVVITTPLHIMTPYQERKKKQDMYKHCFINGGFAGESDISPGKGRMTHRHTLPSLLPLHDTATCSTGGAADQSQGGAIENQKVPACTQDESCELPPDYSDDSDEDFIRITVTDPPPSEPCGHKQETHF